MSTLLPFFKWCDGSAVGQAIRDSRVLFPILEAIHLLALTVLLGTVSVMGLRLIGVGLRGQPMAAVGRSLAPLTFWSLLTMLATGSMLFASEALKCYQSPPFMVKMVTLAAAIVFQWVVLRPFINSQAARSRILRIATAVASLTLWFGVAAAGRAIGFY